MITTSSSPNSEHKPACSIDKLPLKAEMKDINIALAPEIQQKYIASPILPALPILGVENRFDSG